MPVLVKFTNTTSTPVQAQIIDNATCENDGAMSKEQACKLAHLPSVTSQSTCFIYTVQPGDVSGNFFVAVPLAARMAAAPYGVSCTAGTAGAGYQLQNVPVTDITVPMFRAVFSDILTAGDLLVFTLTALTV